VLRSTKSKQMKAKMGTFVLDKQTDGQFYWKLNAANG